jgi:outer membrane receptor for ferrienterochelin and colicins
MLTIGGEQRTSGTFGFALPLALRRFLWAVTAAATITIGSAAEPQVSATQPAEPTEPGLKELLEMPIPVVEAASKYEQPITEAPAWVTIIDSDEVKRYGHRTLADILQTVPGLYVSYDRNSSFLGVRGVNLGDYNNRVLVLVDGHRMNTSLSDSAALGEDFILDVDLIDRVEVVRGPTSSLYGNNAFFGVVNVVTRKGRGMAGYGGEVSGEFASYDTYKGRVTYGHLFTNGLELTLSGTYYTSEGQDELFYKEFNTPANNYGIAENADSGNNKSFFGSLAWFDFRLEGAFITREKANPTAPDFTDFNDNRYVTSADRSFVDLKFAHEFPDVADITARVYYDGDNTTIGKPYGGVLYNDEQGAEWWGAELQATRRFWDRLTLTLGGEYRDDFWQRERILNTKTGKATSELETNRQNCAVYFEGDWQIITNLHLNAGVRYDQYGDFDPAWDPRAALIYNPFGQAVFKAIYGTAFRAPNFFELADARFRKDIEPETITTYELDYEQGIGDHLRSSLAGYYNQIEKPIAFKNGRYQNLGSIDAAGVDLALEAFWLGGVRGRASCTFQQTYDSSTGEVLTDSPQQLAKLNLSVPLLKDRLFAGVEFLYEGERTTTHLTPTGALVAGGNAAPYGVVNLTLFSQNLLKGLDLSASVYNLLDWDYSDPSSLGHRQDLIAQDGRSFRVKLTYRF